MGLHGKSTAELFATESFHESTEEPDAGAFEHSRPFLTQCHGQGGSKNPTYMYGLIDF